MSETAAHCPDLLAVLDGIPHGVAILDDHLRIIMMNRHLEAFTGYPDQAVRGIFCDSVIRSSFGRNGRFFEEALAGGIPRSADGDILGLNRSKIPVRFTATPLADPAASGAAMILVLEDRTGSRQAENKPVPDPPEGIIGHSPKMQEIFELLPILAHTDSSLLITGETGTGKDVLAEAIHQASRRAKAPFIKVNCGALPESLLESELFGHVRGAFTGAAADKHGMFQLAQGGTIFLTEIGDLPLPLQVKLLTVLDDREFFPLGSQKKVRVDVRLITGTHRDLAALVREGRFREDLFFRLNVLRVHLPPLRERDGDLRLLTDYFLGRFAADFKRPLRQLSPAALKLLAGYSFPGNVRELRNIIEYGVNLCRGERIEVEHLPPFLTARAGRTALRRGGTLPAATARAETAEPSPLAQKGPASWSEIEKMNILSSLVECGGNRGEAAKRLGWGRTTLWRKIKEYGLG